jgi:hypothetical protein
MYSVQNNIMERELCGTWNTRSVNIKYLQTQRDVKAKLLVFNHAPQEVKVCSTHLNFGTGKGWAVSWCRPLYHRRPLNMILDDRTLWRWNDSLSPAGNPTIPCSSSLYPSHGIQINFEMCSSYCRDSLHNIINADSMQIVQFTYHTLENGIALR